MPALSVVLLPSNKPISTNFILTLNYFQVNVVRTHGLIYLALFSWKAF